MNDGDRSILRGNLLAGEEDGENEEIGEIRTRSGGLTTSSAVATERRGSAEMCVQHLVPALSCGALVPKVYL